MITCSECTTPDECVGSVWCFRRPTTSAVDYVEEREAAPAPVSPYLAPEQIMRRRVAELEHQAQDDANVEAFAGWFPVPRVQPLDARAAPDIDPAPVGLPPVWSVRRCMAAFALFWVSVGAAWVWFT